MADEVKLSAVNNLLEEEYDNLPAGIRNQDTEYL